MKRKLIFSILPLLLLSSCGTKATDVLWDGGVNFYEDPRGYNSIESGYWKCKYLRLGLEEEIPGRPDCVYPNPFAGYMLFVQGDLTHCTWIMGDMDYENNKINIKSRVDCTCTSVPYVNNNGGDDVYFSSYYSDGLIYLGGSFVHGYLRIRAMETIDMSTAYGTVFYNLYFCRQ